MIRLKRIHDMPAPEDGLRVFVDRVWPRGIGKGEAAIDLWLREIGPSTELRRWFSQDPKRFEAFCERYWEELEARPEVVERLRRIVEDGDVTLLYSSRDRERNTAVALKRYLEKAPAD